MTDPPFTPKTLAARWSCTQQHVRALVRAGQLACFRIGTMYRIPAEAVADFEASGGTPEGREDAPGGGEASGSSSIGESGAPSGSTAPVGPVVVPFAPGTAGSPGSGSPTR